MKYKTDMRDTERCTNRNYARSWTTFNKVKSSQRYSTKERLNIMNILEDCTQINDISTKKCMLYSLLKRIWTWTGCFGGTAVGLLEGCWARWLRHIDIAVPGGMLHELRGSESVFSQKIASLIAIYNGVPNVLSLERWPISQRDFR